MADDKKEHDVTVSVTKAKHRATLTYRTALDEIADILCDAHEAAELKRRNDSTKGAA